MSTPTGPAITRGWRPAFIEDPWEEVLGSLPTRQTNK